MSNYLFHDENFLCERCGRNVNEVYSTCGDIECELFDPRHTEDDNEEREND